MEGRQGSGGGGGGKEGGTIEEIKDKYLKTYTDCYIEINIDIKVDR